MQKIWRMQQMWDPWAPVGRVVVPVFSQTKSCLACQACGLPWFPLQRFQGHTGSNIQSETVSQLTGWFLDTRVPQESVFILVRMVGSVLCLCGVCVRVWEGSAAESGDLFHSLWQALGDLAQFCSAHTCAPPGFVELSSCNWSEGLSPAKEAVFPPSSRALNSWAFYSWVGERFWCYWCYETLYRQG